MKGLIFTYALTYGGALASLVRPFVGLLVYVCFAIVKPEGMWYWSVPAGNYSRIVALALLVGWAMGGFGNWRMGRARAILVLFAAFLGWAVLCAVQASDQERAFIWIESMAKVFLPFLVGMTLIDRLSRLKQLAWVIVLSQGYVALEMNLAYFEGFNRLHEVGFAEMDNNCVAIAMVTGVGCSFFLGLQSPRWWQKLLAFATTGLMIHAILFSMSRGGMVALVITGVVAFLIIPKQPKHYLVLLIGVILSLRLAGPEVQMRFFSSFREGENLDSSAVSRWELWADCWDSMHKRPLFGVGPANWGFIAKEYGWQEGKEAHSLWVQLGAEMGFPGLILLALFYGLCVLRLLPLTRAHADVPDPWLRASARMVVAALVGFGIAAQFVSLFGLELPYYVTMIGAGTIRLCSQKTTPAAWPIVPSQWRPAPFMPVHAR